ncbi:MAG: restriction endonuclease subunit S, partial [Crocosphaera sp.]
TYITQAGLKNSSAKLFPVNTVLVAMYGATAGQIGILRFEATTNQAVCGIYPSNKLIPEFLFYCLLFKKDELIKKATGNAQPNISQKKIKDTKIPLILLEEQKQIVAILDEAFEGIDKAIENAEKNLANAREIFESYLNSIFINKGDDWVEKKLGDVCHKVEYGTSSKSQPQGDIPVLRMGNIQNGLIDWNNLVYTSNQDEINKYNLNYNDVLFNRTNSSEHVGKSAIYKGEKPAIFAGYLIRIHRKNELIDAYFLNFYLNSSIARDYGRSVMSQSVNQANINGTKLKSYPISIPTLENQIEITEKLKNLIPEVQKLEAIYKRKIEALQELKQSILQKAFTGELTNPTIKEEAA